VQNRDLLNTMEGLPDLLIRGLVAPLKLRLCGPHLVRFTERIAEKTADERLHQSPVGLRWGLVPHWADDIKIGYSLINARSETAADKPAFRKAFRDRRCLILTDGFYEWQKLEDRKQPYYIRRRDGKPFAFAGLWESWSKGETPVQSCTILTTDANDLMRPLHDRMPVILDPGNFDRWLDPTVNKPAEVQPLLAPCPADWLQAIPVSTHVNNPRHEDASCVTPIAS
jgi:putative SOS response-associated peptidase YedK